MHELLVLFLSKQSISNFTERTAYLAMPSLRIILVSDLSERIQIFWNCFTRSAYRKYLLGAYWLYQTTLLSSFISRRVNLLLGLLIDAFLQDHQTVPTIPKENLFLLVRALKMESISSSQDDYFILIHMYYLAFVHFVTLKTFC